MNIGGAEYDLETRSLDLFLCGCSMDCYGCHNPELHDKDYGTPLDIEELVNRIDGSGSLIKNVRIMGGEPLEQDHGELRSLLLSLAACEVDVWLFTGHGNVPQFVHELCRYIKMGRFVQSKPPLTLGPMKLTVGSSNQCIVDTENMVAWAMDHMGGGCVQKTYKFNGNVGYGWIRC